MPHAIAAAVVKAVVSFSIKKLAIALVKTVVVNALLSGISRALAPKPTSGQQTQTVLNVEYAGTVEGRRLIYGTMKVSGMNCIPGSWISGANGEYLHQVLALAGREVNAITDVYFNSDQIASANIAAVTGSLSDGNVTTGTYANLANIRRYTGAVTEPGDAILRSAFSSNWLNSAVGKGIAKLCLQFKLDQNAYKNGKPEVTAIVQGHKVYDPRLDSTNGGSGSQRYTDPATWTFSSNPALCLRDYLTSDIGLDDDHTKIDDALVITAANICDEVVNLPASATQLRYTCNVALNAVNNYSDNIEALASAMLGCCYWSGGKWRMFAGAWNASSSFALTENDLVGEYTVQTESDPRDKYNAVRGTYWDSARDYQEVEFQPRLSATYEAADGERKYLDTQFPACTNEYEAQRDGIVLLRLSRRTKSVTGVFALTALNIRPFDRGTITLSDIGWTNQNVRVMEWEFDPAGAIKMTLRAEESTDWSDPLTTDYGAPGTATDPAAASWIPYTPTNFSTLGGESAIRFTWTAPPTMLPSDFFELYEYTSSTPFASASLVWSGRDTSHTRLITDTTTRYYWLRTKNVNGNASATAPASTGLSGSAATASGALNGSAYPTDLTKTGTASSLTTASTTVTATGGTAPYTYAWTRLSGSTSIAADSASSATTTFTGTSLTAGSTNTAVFRCTITDNVAATKTVDVNVSISRTTLSVTLDTYNLTATDSTIGTHTITTSSVTATPAGGTSPYTYSWALLSGTALTVNSPSSASTTFSKSVSTGAEYYSTYRVTVTDAVAATATADVDVSMYGYLL